MFNVLDPTTWLSCFVSFVRNCSTVSFFFLAICVEYNDLFRGNGTNRLVMKNIEKKKQQKRKKKSQFKFPFGNQLLGLW